MLKKDLLPENSIIEYDSSFLSKEEADKLFNYLSNNIQWEQKFYTNYKTGEKFPQPRLTAWFADNEKMSYSYSGVTQIVQTWNTELVELKDKIENVTQSKYNSVLLNFYRNGKDSVGFHADNEKEIVKNSIIASISLGAVRKFLLAQYKTSNKENKDQMEYREYLLEHGSLLIMSGSTQQYWKHSVPADPSIIEPRINLTFREFVL